MPSSIDTKSPDFYIRNKNIKLKKEVVAIAKSYGMTYSQWCRSLIIREHAKASDAEKKYLIEDCD